MASKRKYIDSYIKYGFTETEVKGESRPQCVVCSEVLSNEAFKPSKLERHLISKHPNLAEKPQEYFETQRENLKKMKLMTAGGARLEAAESLLSASFEISKLIAKNKKAHTIGESLIKSCLLKVAEKVLNNEAKKKIEDISLSNNTIKSRIDKMSYDVEDQLLHKLKKSPYFGMQCDESTDVSQCSQLLNFVRYFDESDDTIKEDMLLMEALKTTTKAVDVMKIIDDYFIRNEISWGKLAGLATDGAPPMIGSKSGFAALVKEKNPATVTTHCIIHRQVLASKTLPSSLDSALKLAIKVVNTINKNGLSTRIVQ